MSIQDLSTMPQEELEAHARAYQGEVQRRIERDRIPLEIEQTAQRGRDMGLTDEIMVDAVTRRPEPEPEEPVEEYPTHEDPY